MKEVRNKTLAWYWIFCGLRIALVFIPQTGYIHPDEYFQSIEVFASNVFEFEGYIPWDFNITFPIRSVGLQYFTIGLSYQILRTFDFLAAGFFGYRLLRPYTLVVVPRLFVCLLSFLCDWSLYKICVSNNEKYRSRLLILASSYALLIYGSRTFSNTLELISFSMLLYFVSESMIFSNVIVKHQEYLRKRYEKSKTPTERAKFHKLKLFLASHNTRNFVGVSAATVLGFFNRPTFLCYAVFPVFFWVYRGMGFKSVSNMQFHLRMFLLILSAIPVIVFFVIIDSFYYGYVTWGEVGMLDISIKNFVFPNYNFIQYNLNQNNTKGHGQHPIYLHLFVNIPLLFNVLGIFTYIFIGDLVHKLTRKRYHLLPTVRSIKLLMTTSLFTPLLLLSYIPHQEPRFILPLLVPLTYLFGDKIYEEPEQSVVEANEVKPDIDVKVTENKTRFYLKLWIFLNLLFAIFYGFIHQGGIYPAANFLSSEISKNHHIKYDIISSHTYMVPQVLFMQPKPSKLYEINNSKYQLNKRVFFHEEGSRNISLTLAKITTMFHVTKKSKLENKYLLLIPGSLDYELNRNCESFSKINLRFIKSFYPHLSTEAMPDIQNFLHTFAYVDVKRLSFGELWHSFLDIFYAFGLNLYEVNLA